MSPRGTPKTNFDFCLEIYGGKIEFKKSTKLTNFCLQKPKGFPFKGRLKHQTPNKKAEDLASSAVFARFSPSTAIAVVGECEKRNRSCLRDYGFFFVWCFCNLFLAAFGVKICGRNFAAKKTERDNDKNVLTGAKNALMKAPKGFDGAAKTPRGRAPKEPRGAPTRVGQPNTLREPKTPRESLKSPLQKAFKRSTCEQNRSADETKIASRMKQ